MLRDCLDDLEMALWPGADAHDVRTGDVQHGTVVAKGAHARVVPQDAGHRAGLYVAHSDHICDTGLLVAGEMIRGDLSRPNHRSLRRTSERCAAREDFTADLALNSGKQAHFICSKGVRVAAGPPLLPDCPTGLAGTPELGPPRLRDPLQHRPDPLQQPSPSSLAYLMRYPPQRPPPAA